MKKRHFSALLLAIIVLLSDCGAQYLVRFCSEKVFLPFAECAALCTDTGGIDCGIVSLMAAMLADRDHPIQHF